MKYMERKLQSRVAPWMQQCFGPEISGDKLERGDRLLEEVLELLQSGDYPADRVLALRDYVWGRPKGEPHQEAGGTMITLAAYCLAHDLDMHDAGEDELARINRPEVVEKIRAKQAAKPTGSALPVDDTHFGEPIMKQHDMAAKTIHLNFDPLPHFSIGRLGATVPQGYDNTMMLMAALDMAERRILRLEELLRRAQFPIDNMEIPE